MNQKILVTGDQGYIGTYLTDFLIKLNYYVEGVDIGYFKDCNLYNLKANYNSRNVDIRSFDYKDIENFETFNSNKKSPWNAKACRYHNRLLASDG